MLMGTGLFLSVIKIPPPNYCTQISKILLKPPAGWLGQMKKYKAYKGKVPVNVPHLMTTMRTWIGMNQQF